MCEFGVKVLVSAILVAVLSEGFPCGRDNPPITEVVTPTDECGIRTSVTNISGLYVTPLLSYDAAISCCTKYGLEPFILRKGRQIDKEMFFRASKVHGGVWYPVTDEEDEGIFLFPDGTVVSNDYDALFIETRPGNTYTRNCLAFQEILYVDYPDYNFVASFHVSCGVIHAAVCIDKDEFKEAHANNEMYEVTYMDPEEYSLLLPDFEHPNYFQMIGARP